MRETALGQPPAAAASSRIAALDLMRGYLILVIASVHLAYYPSLLGAIDGRGQLWVSEAEGFFFISGLLIGIIRRKDIERSGMKTAVKKVLARGWRLYLAGVILSLIYVVWGRALLGIAPDAVKDGLDAGSSWWNVLFQTLIMRYSYGWSDFLMYYAGFLFVTPVVLWLLRRGWWYVALAGTLGVWYWRWAGGFGPYNSFLQWQVYFFLGAIIGYYWNEIAGWFRGLPMLTRRWIKWVLAVVTVVAFLISVVVVFGPQASQNPWVGWIGQVNGSHAYNRLLVDGRIGLLRPILALLTLGGVFFTVRKYEDQIIRWVGWLLLPFGRNSLYVYIVEGLLLYLVPFGFKAGGLVVNSLIELAMIAIVWLCVRYRVLFKVIPR